MSGGYTYAERHRVTLSDGRAAFVKRGVDEDTRRWVDIERRLYASLPEAPFLARVLHSAPGELWLEDLGLGGWPTEWRDGDVSRVLQALDQLHDTPAPDWVQQAPPIGGWADVARDPAPFLGLGWCTPAWLSRALPVLTKAEAAEQSCGDPMVLLHHDTRSDNLCILPDRVVIVDWNWVAVGPRSHDRAFWSASLHAEGGPPPEQVCASKPWSAVVSGFFARAAGLPDLPLAPRVRWIQRVQLAVALPWAVRSYGLPTPDGPRWEQRDRL